MLLLDGKQVTTLEGLGTIDAPAPIQRAFMEEQAAQCGYCIAGMMMRAQALAAEKPETDRRADPRRAGAESVPLRNPYANPARGASGGRLMDTAEAAPAVMGAPNERRP